MMTMKQLDVPVRQWVPDWLGMICIFFIILPVTMLNGSYTGSMLEVSSTLGTNTEDITMGYYAASAGMAIAYPIVPKVLDALSSKFLLLTDLSIQFLLSWVCSRSQNIDLVIICSFFIGFLKGFLMLWFIRRATKIFSPKNVRSEFYSYFYPLVFAGGQVSMIVTAELAYHYNWQYMYYFMMMMLMASILIVIVCFRHNRPLKPIRLSELHIREMLVIATGLLMLMYVINYGKVLDWTSSFKIRLYLVIAPILIAFFIWKQYHSKQPYVNLAPLYQPKAIVGYFYMMLVMFFSTSTTLLTNYMTSILKVDSTHTYQLYIYLLPGYALGAFICFWWFRWQRWRFRFLIAGGMSCFAAFFGILYFTVSPESTYEMLFLPVFLRGLGMLTHHSLCPVRRRRAESQVPVGQCLFPDLLPFGTGPHSGDLFLQQYPLPAGTKIHVLPVRNNQSDRPVGCQPVQPVPHTASGTRARIYRSYTNGYSDTLYHSTTAKPSAFAQAHIRLSVCHLTGHSHCFTFHTVP